MQDLISWILESTEELLRALGLPENWRDEILPALLLSGLGALVWRGMRLLRLRRRKDEPSSKLDPETERAYLGWLQTRVKNVASFWQRQEPPRPVAPVPLGAKKLKLRLFDRLRLRARAAYLQVRLFRHNVQDYSRNPTLSDLELSVRAGFGRRVKIRNLARELRKFHVIIVLGDPGSGKSVCLRQLARDLATEGLRHEGTPRNIPIFLEMGGYDGWEDRDHRQPQAVLEFVRQSLLAEPSIREAPEDHPLLYVARRLEDLLRQGRVTCIFDALDEMPQDSYQERYRELRGFIEAWSSYGNRFVFSCRSLDYDPAFAVDEVLIDPFDRPRIRAFLELNVPAVADALYRRITEDESLEEMVANPFFLQALAFINRPARDGDEAPRVPTTRGQLVREFAEALLERETGMKQSELLEGIPDGPTRLRTFLSELAFALQSRREGGTSVRTEDLAEVWDHYPDWPTLLQVTSRARILSKRGSEAEPGPAGLPVRIEFVHHRLEELFAAEELARRFHQGWPLEEYLENLWWQETVILAIGLLEDPAPVLRRVIAPQTDVEEWFADIVEQARGQRESDVAEEIYREYQIWREQLVDLALVVRVLGRVRASRNSYDWSLTRHGEAFARRRALFLAAEAISQFPPERLSSEREQVRRNLEVLVREGNSLQQVRALRALRFIASPESLPILESTFHLPSAWVKATALRTLFRLDLREQRARAVMRRFLWRSFLAGLARPLSLFDSGNIFRLVRGLFAGLRKERGGFSLIGLGILLSLATVLWALLLGIPIAVLGFIPIAVLGFACIVLFCAGGLVGLPILLRMERPTWPSKLVPAMLDYSAVALFLFLAPRPFSVWLLGALVLSQLPVYGFWNSGKEEEAGRPDPNGAELLAGLVRTALLATAALWVTHGPWLVLLAGVTAAQLLWAFRRFPAVVSGKSSLPARVLVILLLFAGGLLGGMQEISKLEEMDVVAEFCLLAVIVFLPLLSLTLGFDLVSALRIHLLTRSYTRFSSLTEYLAYILTLANDHRIDRGTRTRAVLRLLDVPFADPVVIVHLMDFAERDLPPSVKDALYQVIDAAERRIHRGQTGVVLTGPPPVRDVEAPSVGALLRPYLGFALGGAVLAAIGAALAAFLFLSPSTARVAIAELGIGTLLLLVCWISMGRRSAWRLSAMVCGAGLLGVGIANLFVSRDLVWVTLLPNALGLVLGLAGALLGCVTYFLDSDDSLPSGLKQAPKTTLAVIVLATFLALLLQLNIFEKQVRRPEFLTYFVTLAPGQTAVEPILQNAQIIRVSLVQVEHPRLPLGPAPAVDEIWISKRLGKPEVRTLFPGGCLAVLAVEQARVVLGARSECGRRNWRLLARVYDRTRSQEIQSYFDLFDRKPRARPRIARLLAKGLSSPARSFWSPPL